MTDLNQTPKLRIAPSPTGNLHIGTARLALFNFLYAHKIGAKLVLRIEDTDRIRSTKEFEQNIIAGLDYLGVKYDEFYRQSERTDIYKKYLQKLLDEGKAYISKEEPKLEIDEKTGKKNELRSEVIRFKNPQKVVSFSDLIHGEIKMDTSDLGDFVIAKSIDEPVFHLAVVVDDFEMGITHVMRGDDHISNTPRHVLIQEAIGAPTPIYAHLPMVLATDRSKMSKRHGATSLKEYQDKGYIREALINFLAFLGWNPGGEKEIYSLAELKEVFDIKGISKSGGVFNIEKLNWFNREYLLKLPAEIILKEIEERMKISNELAQKIYQIVLDRIVVWSDIDAMRDSGELGFFLTEPEYQTELLFWKKDPDAKNTADKLTEVREILTNFNGIWEAEGIKEALWAYVEAAGKGNVLWPLRVSLTGKDKSPEPFLVASILGKVETLKRIQTALNKLISANN